MKYRQPWLSNPALEGVFILSPAILPVLVIVVFQDYFLSHEMTTFWWVLLVLCIDVSHVYSTLFRMYWDKETFTKYKKLLIVIPVVAFAVALLVHLYDALIFWRILAYVAVYHFIRQQYGFMRLYTRKDLQVKWKKIIDAVAIYTATLYPILYWHIQGTEKIAWFVQGDFVKVDLAPYNFVFATAYFCIIGVYVATETAFAIKRKMFNIPKNLIVLGTYLSWYFGIVAFQGDLIFTLLNVVAHGIPYMGLIWIYGEKKSGKEFSFGVKGVITFILVLLVLAYFEESLWDIFVWNDHPEVFFNLSGLLIENSVLLSVVVALLVLPQVTHYVLDGFIWKFSKDASARI